MRNIGVILLLAAVSTACVPEQNYIETSVPAPQQTYVYAETQTPIVSPMATAGVSGEEVFTRGTEIWILRTNRICVGDCSRSERTNGQGNFRLRGCYGGNDGAAWFPGYNLGLRVDGDYVVVDVTTYLARGLMQRLGHYGLTLTSGDGNWRDNHHLQFQYPSIGGPNIPIFIDGQGLPHYQAPSNPDAC